jgi:hypothetical protein
MMTFLTPLFLAASAAIAVPLILHLLQKRRTVTISFSTIRFLKLAQNHSSRRIHVENLLLLILRMLLVVAIALAFAMPIIRTTGFGAILGTAHRDVAIILDGSYSMRYDLGSETAWDRAIRAAQSIVSGLHDGDRVCLFVAADVVEAIIEQPVANRDFVSTRIQSLKPGSTTSQLLPAVASALSSLDAEAKRREREIHIITDGQDLAWGRGESHLDVDVFPENTVCFVTLTGAKAAQNITVSSISLSPELMMSGAAGRLEAQLSFSGPVTEGTASVFVDDQEVDRRAFLRSKKNSLFFALPALEPGVHAARVETRTDNLQFDDAFYFLIHVHEKLPVLCVGTEQDVKYLVGALGAGHAGTGSIDIRRIDAGTILDERLSDYESVFLCNVMPLDGQAVIHLENFLREGGFAVFFPGDQTLPAHYEAWSSLVAPTRVVDAQVRNKSTVLNWGQPNHPVVRTLRSGDGNTPVVSIRRQLSWETLPDSVNVIITVGAQSPFLIDSPYGEGRTLQFAVSADRSWSNFPLSPFYLPILHQAAKHGASTRARRPFKWTTRRMVLRESELEAHAGMNDPDGQEVVIHSTMKDGRTLRTADDLLTPGIYDRIAPGSQLPLLALNAPRQESDLALVPDDKIEASIVLKHVRIAKDVQTLERLIEDHRVGRSLGEALLWLALLLCTLEIFFANFKAKSVPRLSDVLDAGPSGRILKHQPVRPKPTVPADWNPVALARRFAENMTRK